MAEDLIFMEILTLLPVKTLIRFRCVCKIWYLFLSNPDPKFITSHVKRTSQNPEYESLIMGIEKFDAFLLSNNNNRSIDILTRSRLSYTRIDNAPRHSKNLLGSINGLVCVQWENKILLWNPVTSLGKTIVRPPIYFKLRFGFYGFGWNCVDNDYKVVVCLSEDGYGKGSQGFLYSTNLDSWSSVVIPHWIPYDIRVVPDTIVKGCPYWRSHYNATKFDVECNQFKEFLFSNGIKKHYEACGLVNLRDALVMMGYCNFKPSLIDVHHLDEESGVWSKTYTIGPIICDFDFEALFFMCFKYGSEIVFNRGKMLYNLETNGVKVIGDGNWLFYSSFSYTGSLVFLQGMESLHTQSHWRYPEVDKRLRLPRLARRSAKCSWKLTASKLLCCFLCRN